MRIRRTELQSRVQGGKGTGSRRSLRVPCTVPGAVPGISLHRSPRVLRQAHTHTRLSSQNVPKLQKTPVTPTSRLVLGPGQSLTDCEVRGSCCPLSTPGSSSLRRRATAVHRPSTTFALWADASSEFQITNKGTLGSSSALRKELPVLPRQLLNIFKGLGWFNYKKISDELVYLPDVLLNILPTLGIKKIPTLELSVKFLEDCFLLQLTIIITSSTVNAKGRSDITTSALTAGVGGLPAGSVTSRSLRPVNLPHSPVWSSLVRCALSSPHSHSEALLL